MDQHIRDKIDSLRRQNERTSFVGHFEGPNTREAEIMNRLNQTQQSVRFVPIDAITIHRGGGQWARKQFYIKGVLRSSSFTETDRLELERAFSQLPLNTNARIYAPGFFTAEVAQRHMESRFWEDADNRTGFIGNPPSLALPEEGSTVHQTPPSPEAGMGDDGPERNSNTATGLPSGPAVCSVGTRGE